MYWLGGIFWWLCWLALAAAGFLLGILYRLAKSKEEWQEQDEALTGGPIPELLRTLDEQRRHLLTEGEDFGALRSEILAKDHALAGLERQLAGKETQQNLTTIELEKVRNGLSNRDKEIAQLERDFMEAETANAEREDELGAIEKGIAEKERLIRELEHNIDASAGTSETSDRERRDLNEQITALNAQVAQIQDTLSESTVAAGIDLDADGGSASAKVLLDADSLSDALRTGDTVRMIADSTQLLSRLKEMQAKLKTRELRIQELKRVSVQSDEVSALRKMVADRAAELASLRRETKGQRRALDRIDTQLAEQRSRLAALETSEGQMTRDNVELGRTLGDRSAQLSQLEEQVRDLKRSVDERDQRINRLTSDLASRERPLSKLRQQLSMLNPEIAERSESLAAINRKLDRLSAEMAAAEDKLGEANRGNTSLDDLLVRLAEEKSRRSADADRLKKEIATLERSSRHKDDEATKLETRLTKLESDQVELEKTRTANEIEYRKLQDEVSRTEVTVSSRESELREVKGLLTSSDKERKFRTGEASRASVSVEEGKVTVSELRISLKKLEDDSAKYNRELKNVQAKHKTVSSELDELLARLARVRDTVS